MTRVTSHRSATPAHITGHRAPTSYVRRLKYVVNNGPTPLIYNWIACGVCSIIVWFADNVPPSLCSTSACAVQIQLFQSYSAGVLRHVCAAMQYNNVHALVQWRNVDAVRMRTLNKGMAARYQQENHVTRYPVILYRSVTYTNSV